MGKNSKRYELLKLFCLSVLAAGALIPMLPSNSCAQDGSGCAVDTWVAMTNQAVLQTRREDLVNKRFIVKADSVLQYSCFTEEVNLMAGTIGPIFSTNEVWSAKVIPNPNGSDVEINVFAVNSSRLSTATLDASLTAVVRGPLEGHILQQFPHQVLSSTTPLRQNPFCHDMSAVWQAAKCKNFDGIDVFYRFERLVTFDPRKFPPEMPCG